jgi:hypothetical protein
MQMWYQSHPHLFKNKPHNRRGCDIYTDSMNTSWMDWSYDSSRTYGNKSPVKEGTTSLKVTYTKLGGGASWNHDGSGGPIDFMTPNAEIRFWAYSPKATNILVYALSADGQSNVTTVPVSIPAGAWKDVRLSRAQLGNPTQVKRLTFKLNSKTLDTIYYDSIRVIR